MLQNSRIMIAPMPLPLLPFALDIPYCCRWPRKDDVVIGCEMKTRPVMTGIRRGTRKNHSTAGTGPK